MNKQKCNQCDFVCHDYGYLAMHKEREHTTPAAPKDSLIEVTS